MSYQEYVVKIIDQYKQKGPGDIPDPIPILNGQNAKVGFLRAVTADYKEAVPGCVELFARWRKENPTISPSQFVITNERTEKWLNDLVINNNNRIIFLIQDLKDRYIGHIGFAGFRYEQKTAEVDSVLRGEKNVDPGMMQYAMAALLQWGRERLLLEHFDLEVLSDNAHAVSFYERCGFIKDKLIPLVKVETSDEVRWIPSDKPVPNADKYYLRMVFC